MIHVSGKKVKLNVDSKRHTHTHTYRFSGARCSYFILISKS